MGEENREIVCLHSKGGDDSTSDPLRKKKKNRYEKDFSISKMIKKKKG